MSPWSAERVGIALYPERLVAVRVSGRLRPQSHPAEVVALAPPAPGAPAWRPAVDALAQHVSSGACAYARVSVVLSSRFLTYVHIPWNDALAEEDEQLAYARERCRAIHGGAADAWVVRASPGVATEDRIACAVEAALVGALEEAMRPLGRRYRSLQPHLMACYNGWRRSMAGGAEWLVVHEPGLVTIALLESGAWRRLRAVKAGPGWRGELAGLLTREQCMTELAQPVHRVLLATEDDAAEAPLGAPWQVEPLALGAAGAAAMAVGRPA